MDQIRDYYKSLSNFPLEASSKSKLRSVSNIRLLKSKHSLYL